MRLLPYALLLLFSLWGYAFAQDGSLDNSFGNNGKTFVNFYAVWTMDVATTVVQQADGKVLVMGYSRYIVNDPINTQTDILITRIHPDGSLDLSFGTGGKLIIPKGLGGYSPYGKRMALQSDGKIVIASEIHNAATGFQDKMIMRLNTNGSFDNSFGTGGKVFFDLAPKDDYATCIAIQPDGKIIVAGNAVTTGPADAHVLRLHPDGSLDQSFDNDGIKRMPIGTWSSTIRAVRIQDDGKIVLGGNSQPATTTTFTIIRLHTDGSFDEDFDGDGIKQIPMAPNGGSVHDLVIQPDCKIIAAGYSQTQQLDAAYTLVRVNKDGSLDNTFDNDGIRILEVLPANPNHVNAIKVQRDGKIILIGDSYNAGMDLNFSAVKLNSDGSYDNSFGNGGRVLYDVNSNQYDLALDGLIQEDGKIILVGQGSFLPASMGMVKYGFAVIRLNNSIGSAATQFACTTAITITSDKTSVCSSGTVSFAAVPVNPGTRPIYQWKKNDIPAGGNSETYTDIVRPGDIITCELTSNACCGDPLKKKSNPVIIQGSTDVIPEVVIAADMIAVCAGTTINFTAANKSGHANASYQWKINGSDAGTDNSLFATNSLTNEAIVECIMSVMKCDGTTAQAISNPVTITVNPLVNASLSISTDNTAICERQAVTFTANPVNAGNHPGYQWQVNGVVKGGNSPSYISSELNNGDQVSCQLIPGAGTCIASTTAVSNIIAVTVVPRNFLQVDLTATAVGCNNQPVFFTAGTQTDGEDIFYRWFVNSNPVITTASSYKHANPQNGDQVYCIASVENSTCNYTISDTSALITLAVDEKPLITVDPADTSVSMSSQVQINATIGGNYTSFQWNPSNDLINAQSLNPITRPVEKASTFALEVYYGNGCMVSRDITIKPLRKLMMPNSFTPDNNNKNDRFRIPPGTDIQLDEFAVFNRWGEKVFSTKDITKGWDGTFRGKLENTGVYVFVIKGKKENKPLYFKGIVLLLR